MFQLRSLRNFYLPGAHQGEPISPIPGLGVNPFPSRSINRTPPSVRRANPQNVSLSSKQSMDGLLGFRLRPPIFFFFHCSRFTQQKYDLLGIDLIGKGLTRGISGDRGSPRWAPDLLILARLLKADYENLQLFD